MNKSQQATYRLYSYASMTIVFSVILMVFSFNGCKSTSGTSYTQSELQDSEGLLPLSTLVSRPRVSENTLKNVPIQEDVSADTLREQIRSTALTGARRLPTLREQMSDVADAQQHILSATDSVLSQLNEIRLDIEVIKNTLDNTPVSQSKAASPSSSKPKKNTNVTAKTDSQDDVILPDEKVVKSKKEAPASKKPSSQQNVLSSPSKEITARKENEPSVRNEKEKKPMTDSLNGSNYKTALRLISRREYAQSIPYLQASIEKPENVSTKINSQYWLGESYFATGKYDEAVNQFKAVLAQKNSAKLDDAMIMLGETYFRQGKKEDAKKTFSSLLSTFPTSEFVPRARKRLQQL